MISKELLSAITALGLVSGVAAVSCDDPTATIASAADATTVANCDSIEGSVLVSSSAGPTIDISGSLESIGGSLIVQNNGLIQTLSSDSIKTIGDVFQLKNNTALTSLSFSALSEVGSIDWSTLNALPEINFGTPGITKADSVVIADTFVQTIEGINVQSLTTMNINNNRRITKFSSSIKNLKNELSVQANGLNLTMELPNLEWIANMTIANVTEFSVPSLKTVNGSMRFDSNYFTTFLAPNLTEIQEGDLSFVSNPELTNISLSGLEKVGGGFTIANNTALTKITGFSGLTEVGGAVKVVGSFDEISFAKLEDVKGTMDIASTEDISSDCDTLNGLSSNVVQGGVTCESENANANNDTSSAGDGDSTGTGNQQNAASLIGTSASTIISLAAVGAFVTAFM
ncbi:hypothetical protein F5X96DRAFT_335036 [Biscogniauxia mediterranea]|nr:hypothetical protein F5X96DRAFT_335036 [Biscogniauxia mediterranea]